MSSLGTRPGWSRVVFKRKLVYLCTSLFNLCFAIYLLYFNSNIALRKLTIKLSFVEPCMNIFAYLPYGLLSTFKSTHSLCPLFDQQPKKTSLGAPTSLKRRSLKTRRARTSSTRLPVGGSCGFHVFFCFFRCVVALRGRPL